MMLNRSGSSASVSAWSLLVVIFLCFVHSIPLPKPRGPFSPSIAIPIPVLSFRWTNKELKLFPWLHSQQKTNPGEAEKQKFKHENSTSSNSTNSAHEPPGLEFMSNSVEVRLKPSDIFRVLADLENYVAWAGTGIYDVKVLEYGEGQENDRSAKLHIKCGSLGFSFLLRVMSNFHEPVQDGNGSQIPYTVTFKLMEKAPLIDYFEGRYYMHSISNGTLSNSNVNTPSRTSAPEEYTRLQFSSVCVFRGPIPGFIQSTLKKIVNEIATKELMKYCHGPKLRTDFESRPLPILLQMKSKGNSRMHSRKIRSFRFFEFLKGFSIMKMQSFLSREPFYRQSTRMFRSNFFKLKNITKVIDTKGEKVANVKKIPGVFLLQTQIYLMVIIQMVTLHPLSLLQNKKWKMSYSQLATLVDSRQKIIRESKNSSSSS